MSPRVSVIVPTRNRVSRLPVSLKSAFSQTFSDIEVIVVDDGSEDGTPAFLEQMSATEPRLRVIRHEHATERSEARNDAIRSARGDLLAFLDDDDRWHPEKLRAQMEYLDAHRDVGVVTCLYEIFDERTRRTVIHRGPTSYSSHAMLWTNFPGMTSLGLVRRSMFDTDPLFDRTVEPCEDWDYWVRCVAEAEVATMPQVLCQVVFHGETQSTFDRAKVTRGRTSFVAKHSAGMTADCRAYHEARVKLMAAATESERFRLHLGFLLTLPAGVRRILATETLSARWGRITHDPGRGHRTLLRLIGSDP